MIVSDHHIHVQQHRPLSCGAFSRSISTISGILPKSRSNIVRFHLAQHIRSKKSSGVPGTFMKLFLSS